APSRRAFFYPRPVLPLPAFDGLLVALDGARFRFLGAPLQAMHQPTDMIAMVMHSELAPDDFGDAGRGPQLRPVAVRLGPLQKHLHQAAALARAQLQRASRREAHPQSVGSPSAPCPEPTQDRTGGALDATPYFVQRQARVPQGQSAPATVLEQIGTSLQSGHTCSLLKGIVLHYLCRCQYYVCVAPCGYCGGGADAGCEKDNCSNASCGSGSTQYCIYEPTCGMFPRCLNLACA